MSTSELRNEKYLKLSGAEQDLYASAEVGSLLRECFTKCTLPSDSYTQFADIFGDVILGLEETASIIPALISLGIAPEIAKQTAEKVMKFIYPDKEFVFVLHTQPTTPAWTAADPSPTEQYRKTLIEKMKEATQSRKILSVPAETLYVEPPLRRGSYNAMLDVPNYAATNAPSPAPQDVPPPISSFKQPPHSLPL